MTTVPNPPPAPAPTETPKAKKPIYKRWWFWLLAGLLLLIAIASAANGGDYRGANRAMDPPSVESSEAAEAPVESKPTPAPEPELTAGQQNALEQAQSYVDTMPFSKAGLMEQLTSEYGGQFDKADAEFAIDNVRVDWNAEAVEAAQSYLDTMSFSRDALIEQLTSEFGSQFTRAEAEYAVAQVY